MPFLLPLPPSEADNVRKHHQWFFYLLLFTYLPTALIYHSSFLFFIGNGDLKYSDKRRLNGSHISDL
jgi:hypothetical protein